MTIGMSYGGDDGELTSVGLVVVDKIFETQNDIFYRLPPFESFFFGSR